MMYVSMKDESVVVLMEQSWISFLFLGGALLIIGELSGVLNILDKLKGMFCSSVKLIVKLDGNKGGYIFPARKLNSRYDKPSICLSLKISNKSTTAITIEDIYITNADGELIGYHDSTYITQYSSYEDAVSEPIPSDCRLQSNDVISKSVRIPDISALKCNDDGSAKIVLVIKTVRKEFREEFLVKPYNEEHHKQTFCFTSVPYGGGRWRR